MLESLDIQAITGRGRRRKKRDVSKNQNCFDEEDDEEEEGVFSSLGNLIPEFLYLGIALYILVTFGLVLPKAHVLISGYYCMLGSAL